jgi:tetratricopeptide (TPR) repeat protein
MKNQASIGGMLRLIAWVSLLLVVLRAFVQERDLAWPMFGVIVGVPLAHGFYFGMLPAWLIPLATRGRPTLRRRLLGAVVATPSLMGSTNKAESMSRLVALCQAERRFADGEFIARAALSRGELPAVLESRLRHRLADCLEEMGLEEEAELERARARGIVKGQERDAFLEWFAEGRLHQRNHRYGAACEAYRHALDLLPEPRVEERDGVLTHLVVASTHAHLPAETVRWGEAQLALKPHGPNAAAIHATVAASHDVLGRYQEAEDHVRAGLNLAKAPGTRADLLIQAAGHACRRGALNEAECMAADAEALGPRAVGASLMVQARVHGLRGEYTPAIKLLEQARKRGPMPMAQAEARRIAEIDRWMALYHVRLGQTDRALMRLAWAEDVVGDDPRLKPGIDAAFAWIHAVRREVAAAHARLASAEAGLQQTDVEPKRRRTHWLLLGHARLALGDAAGAEPWYRAFLELDPEPVYRPQALYFLAECRQRQGDLAGAIALDREAASTDIGLLYERLARERLASYEPVE